MKRRLVLIKEQAEVVDRKNQELTRENVDLKCAAMLGSDCAVAVSLPD
jgi:hypothetical protein